MKKVSGGRPTRAAAEQLSEKIIGVAAQLMLEHGYSGTSMEAVASAAGVAKRTLYSRFPDKNALFAAVVQRRREKFLAPVAKISAAGGSIEEQLTLIGRHMLDWAFKADTVALKRLMSAEVERFPELAANLHGEGRERTVDIIAAILEKQVASGKLRIPDIRFAAWQFLVMVMAPADLLAHYGHAIYSPKRRRDYIEKIIELFLNGCRSRS